MKALFQTAFLLLFFSLKGWGQEVIHIQNSSFEDTPKTGEAPYSWYDCGGTRETPPDVQPGSYGVDLEPYDGKTYLGMVVRDDETWEAVCHQLPLRLSKDSIYELRIFLARSEQYLSVSKLTGQEANYTTPVKLQIWGGTKFCDKYELLAVSPLINNSEWEEYILELSPKRNIYNYITLEAYYKTPVFEAYNGNILLDKCSLTKKGRGQK